MSHRIVTVLTVAAAASLIASCGGTLIVLADYFAIKSVAILFEYMDLLPDGWTARHFTELAEAALLLGVPTVAWVTWAYFRSGLRAEATLYSNGYPAARGDEGGPEC